MWKVLVEIQCMNAAITFEAESVTFDANNSTVCSAIFSGKTMGTMTETDKLL